MKKSTLSKCAAFLLILCLLLSTAVAAGTEGTPPSDEPVVISEAPSDEPVVISDAPSDEPVVETDPPSDEPPVEQDPPSDEPDVEPDVPSDEPPAEPEPPAEEPEGGNEPSGDSEVKVDPNPPRESSTVTNSAAGTESHIWVQEPDGTWRYVSSDSFRAVWGYVSDPYGNGATWYDLTADGAMLVSGLMRDNAGNYYSLDTSNRGYFGMLRYNTDQSGANIFFNNGKTTPGTDRLWCDSSGNVLTGWQYINGKWYYLNPNKDGTLKGLNIGTSVTPDGYEIDAIGAWTGR